MRPDDLGGYAAVSDPQLHPDGIRVAFVVSRMNLDEDRYDREIWLWDGSTAHPFSRGRADTRPRWSPDGDRLAFLRGEGDDPAQVAVMPSHGGKATALTQFALGVREAEWSPDGSRLAVIGVEWNEPWGDLDEEERERLPRRITGPGYRYDDQGWLHDRRANVYLVALDGVVTPLTDGDVRDSSVGWRPDGGAVGFLSPRHPERYLDGGTQPWEVPIEGGEAGALADVGFWYLFSYRDDGRPHLVGFPDRWGYPDVAGLWRIGDRGLEEVGAPLDRSIHPPAPPTAPPGPQWIDGGACLTLVEDSGRIRVARLAEGGEVTDVAGGDRLVTGVSPRSDGTAFAFTATSPTDPGELWWWEEGTERRLTDLNEGFRAEAGLVAPEHFVVARDGVEIDAWVLLPDGDEPVPALLNIHGGPATQYGFEFFDEFQVYAGAGYAVVACNPRGSSGRGRDFMRAPVGTWSEDRPVDLEDILAVLDTALERHPRLDPERLGIMGGSYGGFMTVRILAVDDRFRSAVPERGLYAFTSFLGTSDIGYRFPRMYLGSLDPGEIETVWAASPLSRAHRVTTPTLIVHSERDDRCPIEQGEQLFAALVANGVEVEMLRFPGGSHELSRSGKPKHRRERFEAILDWHDRHL